MRPPRYQDVGNPIDIINRANPTQFERSTMCMTAYELGYHNATTASERNDIGEAACRIVAYDFGLKKAPKGTQMLSWTKGAGLGIQGNGGGMSAFCTNEKMGPKRGSYTARLEEQYPGYIRKMYRLAVKVVGVDASWREIAEEMNRQSREHGGDRPELTMGRDTLRRWFKSKGGKVRKIHDRPILTPERKLNRMRWCQARKEELVDPKLTDDGGPYYVFLDEKWFYVRSGRKKAKYLPPGDGETEEDAKLPTRRTVSRRFSTKVMVMGVVARPVPEHGFTGKIYLRRVSKTVRTKKNQHVEVFSENNAVNESVKSNWQGCIDKNMTCREMLDRVAAEYDLDAEVASNLDIRFKRSKSPKAGWQKMADTQKIDDLCRHYPTANLTLHSLRLQVFRKKGTKVEKDVTCDSKFMAKYMPKVGRKIRKAHHWLPDYVPIFLVMDNAGGHGKKEVIDTYRDTLAKEYNVVILHQEPRGPEMNLLDLGVWVSLQSWVEKQHRNLRNDVNALAKTIDDAWGTFDSSVFERVYTRWLKVLDLVIADNGDNGLVDTHRGDLYPALVTLVPAADASPADENSDGDDSDDIDDDSDDDEDQEGYSSDDEEEQEEQEEQDDERGPY